MRSILLATMLLGGLLLAGIVRETDVAEAWRDLKRLGAGGMGLLLAVDALRTLADATSWLLTLPANLGTQEGALVLVCGVLFGSPALGLALAAIRRARDVAWIAGGLVVGSAFSVSLPDTVRNSEGAS